MQKLNMKDINNQTLIDARSQHEYQSGHIKNSLNLNPGNFKIYTKNFLTVDQPIVFVVDDENPEELQTSAKEEGFTEIGGYLLIEDMPDEELQKTATISAKEFLDKKEDYILLDVRHPDEITRFAPEKNLVNIPLEHLAEKYSSLDKNKEIYTLCGSGNRGTSAASYLSNQGFNSTVIEGGMKAVQELTE